MHIRFVHRQNSCFASFHGEESADRILTRISGSPLIRVRLAQGILSHDGMILGQFRGEKLEGARGKRGKAVGHRVCAR